MEPLFATSDVFWVQLFAFLSLMLNTWMTWRQSEAAKKAKETESKVVETANEVKAELAVAVETVKKDSQEKFNVQESAMKEIKEEQQVIKSQTNGIHQAVVQGAVEDGKRNTADAVEQGRLNAIEAFDDGVQSEKDKQVY